MKKHLRITSPIPPSVNSYLKFRVSRNQKGRHFVQVYKSAEAESYTKAFTKIVKDAIEQQQWSLPDKNQYVNVEATFYFPRKRMDTNNHWKLPLDVFTAAGVYLDDDKVQERAKRIYIDKSNPRVEYDIYVSDNLGVFDNEDHAREFCNINCKSCSKQVNKCGFFKEALDNKINEEAIDLKDMLCHKIKVKKSKK